MPGPSRASPRRGAGGAPGAGDAAQELIRESRIAELQHGLIDLAGRGHLLRQANVLRAVRSEVVRLDLRLAERIKATDPDPAEMERAVNERKAALESLVTTIDTRTNDLDQRLTRFTALLDESLAAAEERARDIARVVAAAAWTIATR